MKNKIMKSVLFNKFFVSFVLVLVFLFLFSVSSVSADEYYFSSGNITNSSLQGVIDNSTPDEVIINLDDGEYSMGQINITRNATIVGNSSGNVKINGSGTLFNITASNVKLINLTITGYTSAIVGNSSDLTVTGNNITTSGVSINISSSGGNLSNILIEDNVIVSSVSNSDYGAVFVNGNGMAISFVSFINNSIRGNGYSNSNGVRINSKGLRNLTFDGNNITGTSRGVLLSASSSNNTNITFANNNITGTTYGVYLGATSSNNTNIIFANNNITGTSGNGVYLYVIISNNTNITFANNNITGTSRDVELYAFSSNNTNISFANNNMTGASGVALSVGSSNNTNITFANNNITGTSGNGVYLIAYSSNNTNMSFANNNITGTSGYGVCLYDYSAVNTNMSFANNNITGTTHGVYLYASSNNNTNITFANNNITGVRYGVSVYSDNINVGGVLFLNNTINATSGNGFIFFNNGAAINVTDFIIRGNNIFANNTGLNFNGLKNGSLVNVTVEYNRILSPVGVNITSFNDNSSFNYNWWGVNDITGKTLGVDTVNHFILNVTNLTSLDSVKFGDDVSFAFLVLNTSMNNSGVEYLPYFVVNGTYNGVNFTVNNLSNFTDNWTVSKVGDNANVFAATLDSQNVGFTFNVKADTNSTISVDDVHVGTIAVISGQLDNYAGNGSDLLNVTVDGNLYENVVINSTGGWNLTYLTNRTGNITVTVNYSGNDNYTSFTNTSSFSVLKNSTNSTILVPDDVHIGDTGVITGQLANFTGIGSVNVTVDGKIYNNVAVDSTGGNWTVSHLTNHTGNYNVIVNYTGSDAANFTGFINSTSFEVTKLASNSSIVIPVDIKVNETVLISGFLSDENNNPISDAIISVIVGGESFNVTTDSDGGWGLNYTPEHSGVFNLSLFYQGDSRYDGFVENKAFNVSKLATNSSVNIPSNVKVGKSITVSGVLTSGGKPLANTSVLVIVDGKTYKVTTNNIGVWKLSYTPKKAGKSTMKVSFAGNNDYLGFNVSKTFDVIGKVKIRIVKISKLVKVGKYRGFNLYSKVYTIKNVGSALGSKDYVKYFKNWYLEKLSKTSKIVKYQFSTKSRVLKVQVKNLGVGKQVKIKILVTYKKRQ
ncbi:beta strand repeat-containing protein [Methanobrevibacter arboriphilus]|uniref:Uncharacterized protein n=1 Tax=Methanobrevibacter arboriphilus TaxID=39441 RepID=A0ACA8R1H9_METAZ|nr:right-handed parallel beta-helix repeat-containing protein [Methanobrevibacter arboriphilus]BBL61113.1 hypothetical protein MarbSA_01530 [Methanobrevibacter arboriphilus]